LRQFICAENNVNKDSLNNRILKEKRQKKCKSQRLQMHSLILWRKTIILINKNVQQRTIPFKVKFCTKKFNKKPSDSMQKIKISFN